MASDRRPTSRRSSPSRVRPGAEALEARRLLATIVVDSAGDADGADQGPTLSLRQAIEVSNGTLPIGFLSPAQAARVTGPLGTPNTIDFAIPGTGPFTIMPTTALSAITSPAVIDGYSQPGAHPNTNGPRQGKNTVLQIELNGTQAGPGASGLDLKANGNTIRGLAIGGFGDVQNPDSNDFHKAGIFLEGGEDLIEGNFIGTDITGTSPLPNAGSGIGILPGYNSFVSNSDTIGGTAAGAGNVISGNAGVGLRLGPSSLVEGNFIGTDLTGTKPIPNGGDGIRVELTGDILGNASVGGFDTIGGMVAGAGNLISGNGGDGLTFGDSSLVQGNLIGTDITGTRALPNGGDGIHVVSFSTISGFNFGRLDTIGGTAAGAGNVISGNAGDGLSIGDSSLVQGNLIGTDITGTSPLPNGGDGIDVPGKSNTVGGTAAGAGNTIAYNRGGGVAVRVSFHYAYFIVENSGQFNRISGNSIFGNQGMGIQLLDNYESFLKAGNSPDHYSAYIGPATPRGANALLNAPAISSVVSDGAGSTISGTYSGEPSTAYALEFFDNPAGTGQGRTFMGTTNVTTDASGNASFRFAAEPGLAGHLITATATDPLGDTSEFSGNSHALTPTTTQFLTGSPLSVTPTDPVVLDGVVALASGGVVSTDAVTLLEDGLPFTGGQNASGLDAAGHFRFTLPPLAAGSHVFTVAYVGTRDLAPSTSASLTVVARVATTTTLATSPASPVSGQPITLTATVAGPTAGLVPGGSVTFIDRSTVLGSATLDASGHASIVISAPDGLDTFAAVYDGSPAYLQSVSAIAAVTSARVTPAVVLVGPSNLALTGQALPFVAIVVPSGGVTPTGSVAFGEDGVVLATVPLDASGRATFITSTLPPGPHVIAAVYLGDGSDNIALSNFTAEGVLPSLAFGGPTVTSASAPTSHSVKLTFSRPLRVGPAQDPANYAIVGPDGHGLTVTSAAYDPADDSVTVTTLRPLKAGRPYRVSVDGVRVGRVVDVYGIALDGRQDGRPGSKFVATVRLAARAQPTGPRLKARVHEKGL